MGWISSRAAPLRVCATERRKSEAKQALIIFALFLALSVILTSCVSTSAIQNVPLSYNAIKTVVVSNLPGGVRRESPNGRTLTSAYFNPDSLKPEIAAAKIHAYAVVVILGSTRPYDIDIHVFKEEKTVDGYEPLGEDTDLSDRLGERLRAALADRREDRNVIDDFRAF